MRFFVLSLIFGIAFGFFLPVSVVTGDGGACDPDLSNEHVDHSVDCDLTQEERPLENVDRAHNLDETTQALVCNLFLLMVNIAGENFEEQWEFQDGEVCRFVNAGQEEVFTAWAAQIDCEDASAWVTRMALLSFDCDNDHNHGVNGCDINDPACE